MSDSSRSRDLNHVESATRVLEFVASEITESTVVDVMAQCQPYYKAAAEDYYAEIGRPITEDEYQAVVDHARDVGLERLSLDRSMLERRPGLQDWR